MTTHRQACSFALAGVALWSCAREGATPPAPAGAPSGPTPAGIELAKVERAAERELMVARTIEARGVRDPRVLAALRAVPRHRFVPEGERANAYADSPLPIGHRQTISQPYVVALMSEAVAPGPGQRVLEIGTGSGYQAAVLAEMGAEVWTIEIVRELGEEAARTLRALGYGAVRTRIGDGYHGWPEAAPFDAIVVTAAPGFVPPALVEQLAPGGRMVLPVGERDGVQELMLVRKDADGRVREESLGPVRFVPMTGAAEQRR